MHVEPFATQTALGSSMFSPTQLLVMTVPLQMTLWKSFGPSIHQLMLLQDAT